MAFFSKKSTPPAAGKTAPASKESKAAPAPKAAPKASDDPADLEGKPGVDATTEQGEAPETGEVYCGEGHVEEDREPEQGKPAKRSGTSKLVYREGDEFAIFLNNNVGANGPFQTYEIVDGPKGDPKTGYYSLPAVVNGVMLEASDRDRGGEVARLYHGEIVRIDKKLQKPYKDEESGELVTHRPFLVQCDLVQVKKGDKTFNKLQPFVAYPVFRKEEKYQIDARPIGYRIPKEDKRGQQQDQQQRSEEDPFVTIWRKQGERGGKNIYITVPEAFAIRDGRTVDRDGVKISMSGVKNGLIETSAIVQGQSRGGFSRGYGQGQGSYSGARAAAPRREQPSQPAAPSQAPEAAAPAPESTEKAAAAAQTQEPRQGSRFRR